MTTARYRLPADVEAEIHELADEVLRRLAALHTATPNRKDRLT